MRKTIISLLFLAYILPTFAQEAEKNASFFEDDVVEKEKKNKLKVNVLGPFYGHVAAFYERDFYGKFSIETGIGVSTRNFYRDLLHFLDFKNPDTKRFRTYTHRKPGYGVFLSVEPKFSFSRSHEGAYIGLQYQYLFSPYKAEKTDRGGNYTNEYYKEKVSQSNFLFHIGSNTNLNKLTFDFGVGYGVYIANEDRYYQENRQAGYPIESKSLGLLLELYLKIGGFF